MNTRERDQQHAAAAEQVGGAAAEQQEAAVAEHVAGDDPLQLRGRQAEVGLDRGERHADHRDVEPVEEQHAAEHGQQAPDRARPTAAVEEGGGGHPTEEYMHVHRLQAQIMYSHIMPRAWYTRAPRCRTHRGRRRSSTPGARCSSAHAPAHVRARARAQGARPRRERVRGARAAGRRRGRVSAACRSSATALHLSQSALSRVVGRLEHDGLAARDVPGRPPRHLRLHHRRRPRRATRPRGRRTARRSPTRSGAGPA